MKTFRTVVVPPKPGFHINHQQQLVSIGSCFSENIGKKFNDNKFNIHINPFGQQYNPQSIAIALNRLLQPIPYTENDLVKHDGLYHSFDHHGSFSQSDKQETLQLINGQLQAASDGLKNADVLFLTFGTAHVFSLKEDNRTVSNCHKFPGSLFNQWLMTPADIVNALEKPLAGLQQLNPKLKVVLTVSPVRYFAFGQYENSVSKAHLFTSIYELQQRYPQFYYFPAYELVMDDLRDYRFFKEDMLHPNSEAINYVWEVLVDTLLEKNTINLLKEIEQVRAAAYHRPRNPDTTAHRAFVKATLAKIAKLKADLSLAFDEEERLLNGHS